MNINVAIQAIGHYKDDKTFILNNWKYQFIMEEKVFKAYAMTLPNIGEKTAKKIFDLYGCDYLALTNEKKMSKVLSPKKAKAVIERASADRNTGNTAFIEYLVNLNLFQERKIFQIANYTTKEEFEKNPFVLLNKPVHLSFNNVNKIILNLQNENPSLLKEERRLSMMTERTLNKLLSNGDTYVEAKKLVAESLSNLNEGIKDNKNFITEIQVKQIINKLNKEHKIKAEKTTNSLRLYNAFYYDSEKFIAEELARKSKEHEKTFSKSKIESTINQLENKYGVKLADTQKLAVETIINNPVAIITGSAGTGKTTVLKFAIDTLRALVGGNIVLAAPTGRAARRMAESANMEASTLHSLLKIGLTDEEVDEADVYVSDDKVEADAIFVDETSMCDIGIIYRLFQKLEPDCRVYFIGDPNQLPPVGSGDVLRDLIDSYYVPTVKLKLIYRQAEGSNIIMNSNKILAGKSNLEVGDDFKIIEKTSVEEIAEAVANTYVKEYNNIGDILEVQCITPKREKGELSSFSLNKRIQKKINSKSKYGECFSVNGYHIYQDDKIICGKNTETVRNGDIGIVTKAANQSLTAVFDTGEETFSIDEAQDLKIALAYCITVHKSQGSEFKTVLLPIAEENKSMLKRNLFYTAVTRAREKMIIVGENKYINQAIINNENKKRKGLLTARIKKAFSN